MRGLLQAERPDGIFCYNDPIALAAIEVVLEAGLRIPEDIAFVGCDNLHFNSTLKAPLSSVDHHSGLVGVRAAKMLLSLLKNKTSRPPWHVALKPSLVVRQSSLHNGRRLALA
jgi:LacI family transcriptional regulator